MSYTTPTVSVIIPSYNHARFIAEAIQSVLDQTFQDFEIVITDDGSTDNSIEVIEKFTDERIRLFRHASNQGACVTSNNCIKQARGKYIAMLSSDDVWLPTKLEKQVRFLEEHPLFGAVFSKIQWVDEQSKHITNPDLYYANIFDVENRNRFQWLNYFFYQGNCLCHPSSLIRREVYNEVGYLDPTLANLPDFDLWIRICLRYEIYVLDEKLVNFRHFADESNASGNTVSNGIRVHYEYGLLLDNYLKIITIKELEYIFPDIKQYSGKVDSDIPFILGKLAVETSKNFKVLWGLIQIHNAFQIEGYAERTKNIFNFSFKDYVKVSGTHDIYGISHLLQTSNVPTYANLESQKVQTTPPVTTKNKRTNPLPGKLKNYITLKRDYKLVKSSGLFDVPYYLEQNPDVALGNIDPIEHFILHGGNEGRNPSPKFSSKDYLLKNPDVSVARVNPLVHYLRFGIKEGRTPD